MASAVPSPKRASAGNRQLQQQGEGGNGNGAAPSSPKAPSRVRRSKSPSRQDLFSESNGKPKGTALDAVLPPPPPAASIASPKRSATPRTTPRKVLEEQKVSGYEEEMNFSQLFESGVAVLQHKFRKMLMGNIGTKPRMLTLSPDSARINMIKRKTNSNTIPSPTALSESSSAEAPSGAAASSGAAATEDQDGDYSAEMRQIIRVIRGAETVPLKRSLRRREKTSNAYMQACDRCFSVCFVDRTWDVEIDRSADFAGLDTALSQHQAVAIRDAVVDFLIRTAAITSLSVKPQAASPVRKATGSLLKKRGTPQDKKNTFRQRRLSTHQNGEIGSLVEEILGEQEGDLYFAKEMHSDLSFDPDLPFSPDRVGTFSCHGIEPKIAANGVSVDAKINQDRGGIQFPFAGRHDMAFFCVMDGHGRGGEKISEHCMQNLPVELAAHPELETNPSKALWDSFVRVDRSLRSKLRREAMYAGTTCIAVLAVGNELFSANSGDSRAVLGSWDDEIGEMVSFDLSEDQKPDTPVEQDRIERMGGFVTPSSALQGPSRIWLNASLTSCGLAMARSLGDHALATVGCIAEPEITVHECTEDDKFIILGSDGVWEFISSQEACTIVNENLEEGADRACMRLIEASSVEWKKSEGEYRDDITGMVVVLPVFGKNGRYPN
uniref:PPM-type phosphatase domain-containing protein n=1 Tax=Rhizochromulina marina TaxID=1034831 RepID=A0A7S2RGY9_9STRA|mmetsp:Transcript_16145/g.47399  ORF Transcript_16145/g.47399 Transcript_16145/m.47399 type:complete len:665 (+) Transcript_16145:120-2114(+)